MALALLCARGFSQDALENPNLPITPTVAIDSNGVKISGPKVVAGENPNSKDTLEMNSVSVKGRPAITATNDQTYTSRELSLRPMTDPADVVKVVPGLVTGQHAGGGKANQYFIRGFDADHGTDLAMWIDGMPINLVSHAHGQGFADLHFIIPELVDSVKVTKGPFDIQYGDLATGGSITLGTVDSVENPVYLFGGMFKTERGFTELNLAMPHTVLAAEIYHTNSFFDHPENYNRYNVFFKTPITETRNSSLNLTLMGMGGSWHASGQVPIRAIDSGWVSRDGSEDPSEGANTSRYSATLNYAATPNEKDQIKASAYLFTYTFSLFSDFNFFAVTPVGPAAVDSVAGDEINQRDRRTTAGFHVTYTHQHDLFGMPAQAMFGVETRNDFIHTDLNHDSVRVELNPVVSADITEGSESAYFMESIKPFSWLYAEAGLRGDQYNFDVYDDLYPRDSVNAAEGTGNITGTKSAMMLSPKLNVVVSPFSSGLLKKTDVFFNYGQGFHSNDARGITSPVDPATPLTKATGYEVGVRTKLWNRWDLSSSLWRIDLQSEEAWDGDDGTLGLTGPTRRQGVDVSTRYAILPWLWADFDMTKNTAVLRGDPGNANSLELAPTFTATGGLSWQHRSGVFGSFRFEDIGNRPGDSAYTDTAYGYFVCNAQFGYRIKKWEFLMDVGNVFNVKWYTAQFETTTRLRNPAGVLEPAERTDMAVVPGAPINVKGGVKYYF